MRHFAKDSLWRRDPRGWGRQNLSAGRLSRGRSAGMYDASIPAFAVPPAKLPPANCRNSLQCRILRDSLGADLSILLCCLFSTRPCRPASWAITKRHRPAATACCRGWDGLPLRRRPVQSRQTCPFGLKARDGVSCWQESSRRTLRSKPPSFRIGRCALETGPCQPLRVVLHTPLALAATHQGRRSATSCCRPPPTLYRCRNSPS